MYELTPLEEVRIRVDSFRAVRASGRAIERRRKRRLDRLLSFVLHQSRFYREYYRDVERPITDLEQLPPVTKPTLMDRFDDVVTDTAVTRAAVDEFLADDSTVGERFLGAYPVWTTSGTTGEPGVFLQDDRSLLVPDAVGDRWTVLNLLEPRALARLLRNDLRTAEIAVSGGHFAAASGIALYQREHRFLRDRVRLFSPTKPLSTLVEELDEFQPTVLVGYSTVLVELAREQRAGRLDLTPAFVAPSGEGITETAKRELRTAFDCTVREVYGATEFFGIALECEHGNLHLNDDWVVLEPVDENYDPVPPGEPSDTVLLTNLANRIQPLVRYDLGDSVTLYDEPCPCGRAFPVLEVEGRQGDVLQFDTDAGESVSVFPLALSTVVEEVPGVRQTQLVKTGPATLRVRIGVADEADERAVWDAVDHALRAFLDDQGVTDIDIEHSETPPKRDAPSGKFRYVWAAPEVSGESTPPS